MFCSTYYQRYLGSYLINSLQSFSIQNVTSIHTFCELEEIFHRKIVVITILVNNSLIIYGRIHEMYLTLS